MKKPDIKAFLMLIEYSGSRMERLLSLRPLRVNISASCVLIFSAAFNDRGLKLFSWHQSSRDFSEWNMRCHKKIEQIFGYTSSQCLRLIYSLKMFNIVRWSPSG